MLAVIGAFAGRRGNTLPLLRRVMVESTRPPDEFWVVCEERADARAAWQAVYDLFKETPDPVRVVELPTPRTGNRYDIIPYSNKINFALDNSDADMFVYLDNGSMPHPEKYELMSRELERNPDMDMVYCAQRRTGYRVESHDPGIPLDSGFCVLNFTQVMHRPVQARWTLDMQYADPDLADALFWQAIRAEFGTQFFPVSHGKVLDEHDMPSPAAQGLT